MSTRFGGDGVVPVVMLHGGGDLRDPKGVFIITDPFVYQVINIGNTVCPYKCIPW